MTAVYNTSTETITYSGTYTGLLQTNRTFVFSLMSTGNGLISSPNVTGAQMVGSGNTFSYSYHLDSSLLASYGTPWTVTLVCYTSANAISPYTTQVAIVNGLSYTVEFVDYDGTLLSSQTVDEGGSATPPAVPDRTGYTFAGWDKAYDNITSNTTVTALYEKDNSQWFTVTFTAGEGGTLDGTLVYTDVLKGTSFDTLIVPTPMADSGYVFSAWSAAFPETVESDLAFTALFDRAPVVVTFSAVGGSITGTSSVTVPYGTDAADVALPDALADKGYVFGAWQLPQGPLYKDAVFVCEFFLLGDVNDDGTVDNTDAHAILMWDADLTEFSDKQLYVGDINADGRTDCVDAAKVLMFDVGIIEGF